MLVSAETPQITERSVVSYSQCARKAYLQMFAAECGRSPEYGALMDKCRDNERLRYVEWLTQSGFEMASYSSDAFQYGYDFIADATLQAGAFSAKCAILKKMPGQSRFGDYHYSPIIFAPTYTLRPEEKAEVLFVARVLSEVQGANPAYGTVILLDGSSRRIRIGAGLGQMPTYVKEMKDWITSPPQVPPRVILNKNCPYCEFQDICRPIAEKEDSISLLGGATAKVIKKYESRGIFSITQLSFLYRPRRRSARKRWKQLVHQYDLQALALRTGNIYVHETPQLATSDVEIFVDIESLPDRKFYYLIGLLVCSHDDRSYVSFWAEKQEDERLMWQDFSAFISRYPTCPLLHYGSFDRKAIEELGLRHGAPLPSVLTRLVNVNTLIFGRVYFPVRSNSLKDICRFIGLKWSAPEASGLQSIVWRCRYEETAESTYRQLLLTYNSEDCANLKGLTDRLREIAQNSAQLSDVRFTDNEKGAMSESVEGIGNCFNNILKSAHETYEKAKIALKRKARTQSEEEIQKRPRKRKELPLTNINKVIYARRGRTCPNHPGMALRSKETTAQHDIVDLVFSGKGVKKVVTRYIGKKGYCSKCRIDFNPPTLRRFSSTEKYGYGFLAWVAYHRLSLRLPFEKISQLIFDIFNERVRPAVLDGFIEEVSNHYIGTEKQNLKRMLQSPAVHADETQVNIRGRSQYVWVFTDGKRAIFRLTETREATIAHEILDGFTGVLVSDFYGGYDSVNCAQQKCWVHLIRDLNDELQRAPFDRELETFVSAVRDLIVPILEAVERFGLKARHLSRFKASVEKFYENRINGMTYKSESTMKFRNRFAKFKVNLFVFLERDGIPWNNNLGLRSSRHRRSRTKPRQVVFGRKWFGYR